jgi:predicted dehydrogenase
LNIRNKPEVGGGALYDIGCYAVSSARFLAAASPLPFNAERSSSREPLRVLYVADRDPVFGTDVCGSGLLDFGPEGPRTSFHVATSAFPAQRVEVMGENGSLAISLPFNAYPDMPMILEVSTSLGTRRIEEGPADQYGLMFAAFSRAIREGRQEPTPIEDGVANMAVLDALFRSEKSGAWEAV